MVCGGCAKRKNINKQKRQDNDLMGGYANLTDRQIKARLEKYKRNYCTECEKRYECDYACYVECRKSRIK